MTRDRDENLTICQICFRKVFPLYYTIYNPYYYNNINI